MRSAETRIWKCTRRGGNELTRKGRTQLDAQADSWRRLTVAVGHILDMT